MPRQPSPAERSACGLRGDGLVRSVLRLAQQDDDLIGARCSPRRTQISSRLPVGRPVAEIVSRCSNLQPPAPSAGASGPRDLGRADSDIEPGLHWHLRVDLDGYRAMWGRVGTAFEELIVRRQQADSQTAAVPDTPESAPAARGTRTWPRRLPVSRSDRADARLDGATRFATHVMVSGCPILQKKPAMVIIRPTASGLGTIGMIAIGRADPIAAEARGQGRGSARSKRVRKSLASAEDTERAVSMKVMISTEKWPCSPTAGR